MTHDVDWERLYRETRHRFGNTMQMLLSLLRLQARQEDGPSVAVLHRLEMRMSAAAAAYALARVSSDDGQGGRVVVDFHHLIADLAEEACRQSGLDMPLHLDADLSPMVVDLERTIPLCIAAMEVLVNAAEHGGPPVSVRLAAGDKPGWSCLTVCDGGTGVPAAALRRNGIGLRITESLMRQVQGQLILDEGPVRMEWPSS